MDVAYNQFASAARRKNRSSIKLNHLSLAPLTSKLPIDDALDLADALNAPPTRVSSYVEGKSAPTTPRLLSRSPGHTMTHHVRGSSTSTALLLPKSKSTTHLSTPHSSRQAGSTTSQNSRRRNQQAKEEAAGAGALLLASGGNDTDWLLRAGALMSTEARESKGQAWLVSRASSTSLTGAARDTTAEDDMFERELARERELHSRHTSRRGSLVMVDDDVRSSPPHSHLGSRSHSRVGLRVHALAPADQRRRSLDGYFAAPYDEEVAPGPDFVNLDQNMETEVATGEEDTTVADEAHVRRLVRRGNSGLGAWFSNVLGVQLFAVDENEEESEAEGQEDADEAAEERSAGPLERQPSSGTVRQFEGVTTVAEDQIAPPKADEGGWQDAAWLMSVASKVLL